MNEKCSDSTAKRAYVAPGVVVYGGVAEITRQNGTAFTDVPRGTPNGGPGTVTGDDS